MTAEPINLDASNRLEPGDYDRLRAEITAADLPREIRAVYLAYLGVKQAAVELRLDGDIPAALRLERLYDAIYESLPWDWRWAGSTCW